MLRDAEPELPALTAFPGGHCNKLWSTNPLERLSKSTSGRTDVVGALPNPAALLRLASAVNAPRVRFSNGRGPSQGRDPAPAAPLAGCYPTGRVDLRRGTVRGTK
jgi:transposase-like protein